MTSRYKKFRWSNTLPEGTAARCKVDVASSTAKTLAGRNGDLLDLFTLGAISPQELTRHFQAPDVVALLDDLNAPYLLADMQIQHIYDNDGEVMPPDPKQPYLDHALVRAQIALCKAYTNKAPGKIIDGLAEYITRVEQYLSEQQLALMPPPPPQAPAGLPKGSNQ